MGARGLILVALLALAACARAPVASVPPSERDTIEARLMADIRVLSGDEFGGRLPGTEGGIRTVDWLVDRMQAVGLQSGTNDPGSAWRAPVELVSAAAGTGSITFRHRGRTLELGDNQAAAFTTGSRLLVDGGEMVFVGEEADSVAAEEIAGKVVVMLGVPGVSPARRTTLFEADPAAIITVIEDENALAGTRRVYGRERIMLASEEERRLTAFVTQAAMQDLLGEMWAELKESASHEGFAPVALSTTATLDARSQRREFASHNVIGMIPGTMPETGAVLLLAHWDHLGECGDEGAEDRICNGAVDNASGIAVMLELARRLAETGPYDRDIYVLATSAEESGLLGARAFADSPPIPLDTIVAAFNFDTVAIAPAGTAVGFIGEGRTPLDGLIRDTVTASGRELGDKAFAEQFVRRQDGWALLDEGVPAVMLTSAFASEIVLGPYLADDYHRASDEIERIELGGAIDDLLLHEELVRRVASATLYTPAAQ